MTGEYFFKPTWLPFIQPHGSVKPASDLCSRCYVNVLNGTQMQIRSKRYLEAIEDGSALLRGLPS